MVSMTAEKRARLRELVRGAGILGIGDSLALLDIADEADRLRTRHDAERAVLDAAMARWRTRETFLRDSTPMKASEFMRSDAALMSACAQLAALGEE